MPGTHSSCRRVEFEFLLQLLVGVSGLWNLTDEGTFQKSRGHVAKVIRSPRVGLWRYEGVLA